MPTDIISISYRTNRNRIGNQSTHSLINRPGWMPCLPPKSIPGFFMGYGGQILSRAESADGIEFRVLLS